MNLPSEKPLTFAPALGRNGFSLLELLVVMAIIGLLIGAGSTVISGMVRPTALSAASAYQGALDTAHARSLATDSHVRVTTAMVSKDGRPALAIGIFSSTNGLNSADSADWRMLAPALVIPDMGVGGPSSAGVASAARNDLPDLTGRVSGQAVTFSNGVLLAPSGRATVSALGGDSRVCGLTITNTLRSGETAAEILLTSPSATSRVLSLTNN